MHDIMTLLPEKHSIILPILLPHFLLSINPNLEALGGVSLHLSDVRLFLSVVRR
jgi:hypothetical protein